MRLYEIQLYCYSVQYRNFAGVKVIRNIIAPDAETLAEKFFSEYGHVDYDIICKVKSGKALRGFQV